MLSTTRTEHRSIIVSLSGDALRTEVQSLSGMALEYLESVLPVKSRSASGRFWKRMTVRTALPLARTA